jgi:hypothetical protein
MAKLHLDMLSGLRSRNAIITALKMLPSGLRETYNAVMERISNQPETDRKLAQKVLAWITYAKKPLNTKAFQHAVAVYADMTTIDDGDLTNVEDLISVCAGIVTYDEQSDGVRLVHYTTQGYLEERLIDVKCELATSCLHYLGLKEFMTPCEEGFDHRRLVEKRCLSHPFIPYAVEYWSEHIHESGMENILKDKCIRILNSEGLHESLAQIELWTIEKEVSWGLSPGYPCSLLHVFASAGLSLLCHALLFEDEYRV